jgi:hypothetical protein
MRVLGETIFARNALTVPEPAIVDNEYICAQTTGERFIVLNTIWCRPCGRIAVEEENGRTGFNG